MKGKDLWTVYLASLTIVGFGLAGGGALAEELEDPTGTACLGHEDEAECGMVAMSPQEDASCQERGCLAVSASQNASGGAAASGTGDASGTYAASLAGDTDGYWLAVSATGDSEAVFVAVSSLGDSKAPGVALSGTGDSEAVAVAVSGTGETNASIAEVNGMEDAESCLAVSATGSADSECGDRAVSGCDTGRDHGTDELCRGPDEREQVGNLVVCDTDLASSDGQAHAWCGITATACVEVVWGVAGGPLFVGGYDGCQAGVFYDEDGHDHAPIR